MFGVLKHANTRVDYLWVWWPRSRWAASWRCRRRPAETCRTWASPATGSRTPPWWGCSRHARPRRASGTDRWAAPNTRARRASTGRPACRGGSSCAPVAPSCWPAASPLPWFRAPAGWAAASGCNPRCGRAAGRWGCPRTGEACRSCALRCRHLTSSSTRTPRLCKGTWAPPRRRAGSPPRRTQRAGSCFLCAAVRFRTRLSAWIKPRSQEKVTQTWDPRSRVKPACLCLWVRITADSSLGSVRCCVWLLWSFGEAKRCEQEQIVKCTQANRSASVPFGTVLSVKKLNYPVSKRSPGADPAPLTPTPTANDGIEQTEPWSDSTVPSVKREKLNLIQM